MRIGFSETPTALLREMVRYVNVEVKLRRESMSAEASAGEAFQYDARTRSSGDDSLIDDSLIDDEVIK